MTQRKERTGICKSVDIATVVAIRDVVKNGLHQATQKWMTLGFFWIRIFAQ